MQHRLVTAISAFMAVGRRYTVDIKLHSMGSEQILVQIDESSKDDFIKQWRAAAYAVIPTVASFFNMSTQSRIKASACGTPANEVVTLSLVEECALSHLDRHAYNMMKYATEVHLHEYDCETFAAIAELVRAVNVPMKFED